MSSMASLYALLDQNMERAALSDFERWLSEASFDADEIQLIYKGLEGYLRPQVFVESLDLNVLESLVEKLSNIDVKLAEATVLGLSVGLCLDFRYNTAKEVLTFGVLDSEQMKHPVLLELMRSISGFVEIKRSKDLPRHKARRILELFEASSSALGERGLLRSGTYIGLLGLRLTKRVLPELPIEMMLSPLRMDCQYYGWLDLLAFSNDTACEQPRYESSLLLFHGATDEWFHAMKVRGEVAMASGNDSEAAKIYRSIVEHFL